MSDALTCILIDPFACEVRSIELPKATNSADLAPYYAALSHETMSVTTFEAIRAALLRGGDVIFVDEEGMFKDCPRHFIHAGFRHSLIGKGLIVGATHSGKAISAETPLYDVQRCTVFLERDGDRLRETTTPWVKDETND